MGIWKYIKTATGRNRIEIDAKELQARLRTLSKQDNLEIIHLAIKSILDELEDIQYKLKVKK